MMNKIITLVIFFTCLVGVSQSSTNQVITKLGQVSFFSYTSVENIEATNNQVVSHVDISSGDVVVTMRMNTFKFKKALMEEHFNESYVESDIYEFSNFSGQILDFDPNLTGKQTKIIKGNLELHGVTNAVEFKADIYNTNGDYSIVGDFEVGVKEYDIKIPPLLAGNIAKTIKVTFKFEYDPYQ